MNTRKTALITLVSLFLAIVAGVSAKPTMAAGATATFVRSDNSTQGTWEGVYGGDGYSIADSASTSIPSYAAFTPENEASWVWAASTSDVRGLESATSSVSTVRLATCWYTGYGTFDMNINFTDGNTHQVALYALDWDNQGRSETIQVVDANSNAILNTQSISAFTNGTYLIWNISGHVKINVTRITGPNAVIGGIFFEPTTNAGLASAVATFVSSDTSTEGNWQGVYGADGHSVAQVSPSLPSYSSFAPQNDDNWIWAPDPTDPRAPETASGRIAACWYNPGTFSLDVNLTDGKTHQVAIYAVDWDSRGRAESIRITDANSNAVLDSRSIFSFTNGTYLVWNISGHVTISVTSSSGPNAVISGIFWGTRTATAATTTSMPTTVPATTPKIPTTVSTTPTTVSTTPTTLNTSTTTTSSSTTSSSSSSSTTSITPVTTAKGQLSITPTSFNFGSLDIDSSASQSFTVTNTGTASVTFSNVSVSGAWFSASGLPNGVILGVGQSATITSTFTPLTTVQVAGGITLTSNASNSSANIILSGSGIQGASSSGSAVTTAQSLGALPVTQAIGGLGFNLNPDNDWEFQMAAAAGASHARFQCSWQSIENQTAPPNDTDEATPFTLNSDCAKFLAFSAKYGLHPTVIAAYGSPYHGILNITVPSGAAAGATTLNIAFASGVGGDTLASLRPFYDTIINSNGGQITKINAYAGGLITSVAITSPTTATLTLASGLSAALPSGSTQYSINEYLYRPPASSSPTDPSVAAYARYAEWLAGQIHASGITGEIEVWNEPPWPGDPWDNLGNYYDTWPGAALPGPQMSVLPNFGFVAALQSQSSPVSGVTYNWGGTEKDGFVSLVSNSSSSPGYTIEDNSGVNSIQPNSLFTTESFHPYGNNPEQDNWSNSCLAATLNKYPAAPNYTWLNCALVPGSTSNFSYAVQSSLYQQSGNPSWGIRHNITETGFSTTTEGDESHQARFVMRQFLAYQANGVTPIEFYRLYDNGSGFGFLNPTPNPDGTYSPLESYTAIAGLMNDLSKIGNSPVSSFSVGNLASVASYSGSYPLDTVHMIGSRPGDSANSDLMTVWQQSMTTGTWATLASPPLAPVIINIPNGLSIAAVLDTVTRADVSYIITGQQVTFDVSDNPIELLLVPANTN